MRHAIAAEPRAGAWPSDRERPLSEEGSALMRRAARGLSAAGVAFDRIYASPLLRARRTAEIVAEEQTGGAVVEVTNRLAPGLVQEELLDALSELRPASRVLLVGHEPDMGQLALALIGDPGGSAIRFTPGTVARIDVAGIPPSAPGTLVWVLTAELASRLAG